MVRRQDICYGFNKRYYKGLPYKHPTFGDQCRAYVPVELNALGKFGENKNSVVVNATPAFGPSLESYGGKDKLYASLKGQIGAAVNYSSNNQYTYEKPSLVAGGVFEAGAKFAIGADRWAENIFYASPYVGASMTYENGQMREQFNPETVKVEDLNAKAGGGAHFSFENSAYDNVTFGAEVGAEAGYMWSTDGTASTPDATKKIKEKIESAPYVGVNVKAGVTIQDAYKIDVFANTDVPVAADKTNLHPATTVGVSLSVLLSNSSKVKPRRY